MSSGVEHRDDTGINREEHIASDGQQTRKAVGLFARDSLGNGTLELSAISTASGAVLSTTLASISAVANTGNVTLNPSPNHIGSVTIFGTVQSTPGMTTLFPGPNQLGSVTVSNTVGISAPTLFAVVNTGASNANVTLNPSPNQIGSVTVSNFPVTQPVSFGVVSLVSGTEVRSLATLLNQPPLVASSAFIGLATVVIGSGGGSSTVFQGGAPWQAMATLYPRTDYLGLVSVSGNIAVSNTVPVTGSFWQATQPVSFSNVTLNAGISQIGSVTVSNPVQLASGANFIGLATVTMTNAINVGMTTLFGGPNQIGSVTVSNFVAPNLGNVTLNPSSAHIGSVSVFGTIQSTPGMTTLFPGPNQIGSVTVSNPVQIAAGTNFIGLATVTMSNSLSVGMTTLFGGPNQIGSVTISNTPSVAQSGNWDIRSLLSLASIYGNVGIIGTPTVFIGTPTLYAVVNTGAVGNTNSLATLLSGPNQIGSVTVSNFPATQPVSFGLVSLASGTEVRSLATLLNQPALVASSAYIGLTTTINATGNSYIGLITTYPARSVTTLFAGYVSASGYSTIFVPPSGQRFFIHSILINSKGNSDGFIGSSTNAMIPWTSLATYGGFPYQHETPGLPAFATDQSMTFRQYSLVTLSYSISTHFE